VPFSPINEPITCLVYNIVMNTVSKHHRAARIIHGFVPVFSRFSPGNFGFHRTYFLFHARNPLTSTGPIAQITLQFGA